MTTTIVGISVADPWIRVPKNGVDTENAARFERKPIQIRKASPTVTYNAGPGFPG